MPGEARLEALLGAQGQETLSSHCYDVCMPVHLRLVHAGPIGVQQLCGGVDFRPRCWLELLLLRDDQGPGRLRGGRTRGLPFAPFLVPGSGRAVLHGLAVRAGLRVEVLQD